MLISPITELSKEELKQRGLIMIFLSAIGGKDNLQLVIDSPEIFWRQNWKFTPYHLRDWMVRASKLPLDYFISDRWIDFNQGAKKHFIDNTQAMAINARSFCERCATNINH